MSSPPLRILHAVSPASVGGLERVVHALAQGHHRRGHDIHLVATLGSMDSADAFLEPLRAAGISVHCIEVSRFGVRAERRFIRTLCLQIHPQVVHTHGYRPDILDGPVARSLGIATLSTEHGMSKMGGRTSLYEWLQLRALRQYDAVAAVSEPITRTLVDHGVDANRIRTIPNAWSGGVSFLERRQARIELGLPGDDPILGWMGRMIGAKGADVLIEALGRMGDARPRVAIVGDGPEHASIKQRATELKLMDRIHFLGEVTDSARFFKAFDGFAMTSRTEGTPIVLFEAMAAGVPIVATRVGGVPNVVAETEAILVESEDVAGLATAIRELFSHPESAAQRAACARKRLNEAFPLEPWLDAYESLYRALIASRA